VRIHVRHLNELIHSCDLYDLYNGTNGYSLCLVNDITNGDITSLSNTGNKKNIWFLNFVLCGFLDRRKGAETTGNDFNVPDYLLPNQKDVLMTPLFTTNNKVNVNIYSRGRFNRQYLFSLFMVP
jgi:hypothetical protein